MKEICNNCGCEIDKEEYDAYDGICQECYNEIYGNHEGE